MRVFLSKGSAEVPNNLTLVSLTPDGEGKDFGVIADKFGELPHLGVVTDIALEGISPEDEEAIVSRAIANLPEYQAVKAQELPYPGAGADQETMYEWSKSFRLGLFPIKMIEAMSIDGYKFVR